MKTLCPNCEEERKTVLLFEVRVCAECGEDFDDHSCSSVRKAKAKATRLAYKLRGAEGRAHDFMMALVTSARLLQDAPEIIDSLQKENKILRETMQTLSLKAHLYDLSQKENK